MAFIIPNDSFPSNELPTYITTIGAVEEISGLDFLHELDDGLESLLESQNRGVPYFFLAAFISNHAHSKGMMRSFYMMVPGFGLVGIGLFLFKEWGRRYFLLCVIVALAGLLWYLPSSISFFEDSGLSWPAIIRSGTYLSLVSVLSVAVYILTRPHVKSWFR